MFEALRSNSNIAMKERKTPTGMVTGWEDSWAHVPGKGIQAVGIVKGPGHSESALFEVDLMAFRHLYSSGLFCLSSTEVAPSDILS